MFPVRKLDVAGAKQDRSDESPSGSKKKESTSDSRLELNDSIAITTTMRIQVLYFISSYLISFHLISSHFTSFHFTSLHFTSLHFTSLHFTSLHFTSLHFTSLHFTSLHFKAQFS